MKKSVLLSLLALLLPLCLPLPETEAGPEPTSALVSPAPAPTPEPLPETVRLLVGDQVLTLPLEDYLCGVLAAEMPASFPPEALKAQAVAARSFALSGASAHRHAEAELCADPGCCQAWLSDDALRERWGADYPENAAKLRGAVEATAGQVLRYGDEPVFAAFHSSSAGATEDCGAVWNPRPYLISVSSPETAADVPNYVSTLRCWPTDFRDTLLSARPEADFSGSPGAWIGPITRDASGRVAEAELGGAAFSGTELRGLFALRSTAFELRYEDGFFVFTVTGYGHGVGMSQYGAMVMARQGSSYEEILAHYYPGTALEGGAKNEE